MPTSQWMRWNSTTHILELSTDFGVTWAPLSLDASVLTAGVLASARIPNLDASILTTGLLALARGGTGVDLSGSGGSTQVLAQSAGHVISARSLVAGDIPNLPATIITSGLLSDSALAGLFTRLSQVVVNLTGSPVNLFVGNAFNNALTLVSVTAPNNDTATLILLSLGGTGTGWTNGWLSRNGMTVSDTISFTMGGSGAQDYTLVFSSGGASLSINKTAVGTITGNTTVKVLKIVF